MSEQHFITIMSSIILVPNVSGVQLLPGKTRLMIKLSELEIAWLLITRSHWVIIRA